MAEERLRRRLAAILAADIAGYSRLMGDDDAATVRDLKGHQAAVLPLISEFGGRIIDTAGDGILAEFPSAVGAVECATRLQEVMAARNQDKPENRRMQFRVGINLGDVIHDEARIYGDGINVAARLENMAEPGGICISEDVYRQIRDKLDLPCRDLGEKELKNIARPVRVYALAGATADLPKVSAAPPTVLGPQPLSIAVLPFVNMSRDEENEYFADGLSEELLNVLAKIRGLRVTSRTSAFSFKGKDIDIPAIAQKLGVAHVLEGSVRKSGKRVRITAQLIEVASDSHLWSDTYDRELDDIFAVQDDIARSVVKQLRRALLRDEPEESAGAQIQSEVRAATKGRTGSAEAYQLFLQGQFFRDRLERENTARAIERFQQALKIDPDYALALAGMSRALSDQAGQSWIPFAEGFDKARATAERALALEPELPEGHAALGWVLVMYDWDWKGADAAFRRALELAPGNAPSMNGLATLVGNLGKFEEAIVLLRRAVELDPLNVPYNRNLGLYSLAAGSLDEAETALRRARHIGPQGGLTCLWLGLLLLSKGMPDEALEMVRKERNEVFRLVGVAVAHFARGERDASDKALQELIHKHGEEALYQVAGVYGSRGDAENAFKWLEKTYAQRDPGLSYMKMDPLLKGLQGDPRWQSLLQRMKLAD